MESTYFVLTNMYGSNELYYDLAVGIWVVELNLNCLKMSYEELKRVREDWMGSEIRKVRVTMDLAARKSDIIQQYLDSSFDQYIRAFPIKELSQETLRLLYSRGALALRELDSEIDDLAAYKIRPQ